MEKFIGIDLGTTYSAISTIDQFGKPVILKNSAGESLTPSVIYFNSNGEILVGAEAKEMQAAGEQEVAMFFKRNMGNPNFYLTFHGKTYSATNLSAILLGKLKQDAELALNTSVFNAVITVPAYFNDLQRTETIKAAQEAGLNVLRIINEPTSAAIMYGMNNGAKKILVYDLGGGTFDVTVLSITDQAIQVLSTGGDHELGGKDWDDKILAYMSEQFIEEFDEDPLDDIETYNDLAFRAELLKKQLSSVLNATFNVSYKGTRGKYNLSREKFEELTINLLHNTTFKAKEVLEEAELTWADIDGVLLVGGSTKMPMVINWVKEMSGKEPLRGINVDEAVCLGAAIQAQIELDKPKYSLGGSSTPQKYLAAGGFSKNITDVMAHSLGLVAVNAERTKYINSIIIPKNLSIPSSEKRPFQFQTQSGQINELEVYLTQGEVEDVSNCIIVGKYVFDGITHIGNGKTVIDIEYQYDSNGIISVLGMQRETGNYLTARKCPLPDDMSWVFEKPVFIMPHLSVVMAIDISGSMSEDLQKAMEAAQNFVNNIDLTNASVGLVAFSNTEKVLCNPTQNSKDISNAIKNISKAYNDWGGGGTGGKPLDLCYNILRASANPRYIIVLTDGVWTHKQLAIQKSKICSDEEIEIIAIGFGFVDKKFLEDIATSNENAFLTNINNLVSSFGNIAQVLTEGGSGLKLK